MSRDAANQAQQTYNTDTGLTASSGDKANSLYSQLVPAFSAEATTPQGFGAPAIADMTTGAEQSAGGSTAGATGLAATRAAADRNSGSFAPTLDQSSRDAGRTLSADTLGIKKDDALLKQSQRQQGLQGLAGLEGQDNNDVLSSLGLQTSATNALTNASPGWFQNMTSFMNAAGKDASAAADLGVGQ